MDVDLLSYRGGRAATWTWILQSFGLFSFSFSFYFITPPSRHLGTYDLSYLCLWNYVFLFFRSTLTDSLLTHDMYSRPHASRHPRSSFPIDFRSFPLKPELYPLEISAYNFQGSEISLNINIEYENLIPYTNLNGHTSARPSNMKHWTDTEHSLHNINTVRCTLPLQALSPNNIKCSHTQVLLYRIH